MCMTTAPALKREKEEEEDCGTTVTDYQLECKFLENVVRIFSFAIENEVHTQVLCYAK